MTDSGLSFSVVIVTYNRAELLSKCLESLQKQTFRDFEVVVVPGPCTDSTDSLLDAYSDRIKVARNPFVNISISRNLGIRAAAGDVVAFIDDDAIPEPEWLERLGESYRNPSAGAVGGLVYGPGGAKIQFKSGAIDVWGTPQIIQETCPAFEPVRDGRCRIMMGTNASFRRGLLVSCGGFDEYIEYYHDESDVCFRAARLGFEIHHNNAAVVHHEFADSHLRKSASGMNFFPVVKNTVYFALKNSAGIRSFPSRLIGSFKAAWIWRREFKNQFKSGKIDSDILKSYRRMWRRGILRGYMDGLFRQRKLWGNPMEPPPAFLRFPKGPGRRPETASKPLRIAMLSREYSSEHPGGIGIYTRTISAGLRALGNEVHVFTEGTGPECINSDGVHVHFVSSQAVPELEEDRRLPITHRNYLYSLAVFKKIRLDMSSSPPDVVETPIWDWEGLVTARFSRFPVVTRYETPMKVVAEIEGWERNPDTSAAFASEYALSRLSAGHIFISRDIRKTMSEKYGLSFGVGCEVIPLGHRRPSMPPEPVIERGNPLILFVGRLEPRKGADTLAKAVPVVLGNHPGAIFVIIGSNDFSDQSRRVAESLKEAGGDRVVIKGRVPAGLLQAYYAGCDMFVAPSRYESFGLIYLEAMAWGKAVVGTTAGGIPEIVRHGVDGILVQPGDAMGLASAMLDLAADSEKRISMGRAGMARVGSEFSPEGSAERTLEFYTRILASRT